MEGILSSSLSIVNTGSKPARNIVISMPLYYSNSPYQSIRLLSGRVSGDYIMHNIDCLLAGETDVLTAEYKISNTKITYKRGVNYWIAKKVYRLMPKTGNCRSLVKEYIERCSKLNIAVREVIGYARPSRKLTAGSLEGCRHSWAEVLLNDVWIPVDLTFKLFGTDMNNHIIEGYYDRNVKLNYVGGKLEVDWSNYI